MESEASQQFCLRWHNHQSSVLGGLPALLDSGRLTDVTLCAGGRSLRAHRIVLSTCSPYFMDIFKELPPLQQPVIVVLGGGWAELCCLVAFMYAGEVTLPRSLLPGLLKLARCLRITGLTDLNGNIPEVPSTAEFDDTFSKFESSNLTPEETVSNRNDSAGCTENLVSPFQKSFESHLASKHLETSTTILSNEPNVSNSSQDETFQGIQLLKQLTLKHDRNSSLLSREDNDSEKNEISRSLLQNTKKSSKISESKRYLNPVLNEIEPKNRKIDKIVENLKCNQRKSQESSATATATRGKSQMSDQHRGLLNLAMTTDKTETLSSPHKMSTPEKLAPSGTKAADIFAGSNIFMEIDADSPGCEAADNTSTNVKADSESSPEIIPELKYVPLSPGIQSIGIHSPTNTKLYATCYVCHKQLSNQYNLRVHLETHQNARHACVACSHVSRSRDALRKHVSYRHPQLSTSHGVGRPCKSNPNSANTQNTANTPPSATTNIFNFPNTSESIDLSASNMRGQNLPSNNLSYNISDSNTNQASPNRSEKNVDK